MEPKTLTLELTGPAAVIDAALDAFARQHGWRDADADGPQADFARLALRRFLLESVTAWNVRAAQLAAADAAAGQTEAAMDLATLTLDAG